MKVAVVHEWLTTHAGSEKVVEQILKLYPDSDLFSLVDFLPPDQRNFIQKKKFTPRLFRGYPAHAVTSGATCP